MRLNSFGSPPVGNTPITGIGGVLGGLISEPSATAKLIEPTRPISPEKPPKRPHKRNMARTGRPPGKGTSSPRRKEKLTVRIDADLAAAYRDWSWDARCNLGELVSQAMRNYLKSRQHS